MKCKKCGADLVSVTHRRAHICPDEWEVWHENDRGDDYWTVRCFSAMGAGEGYAEHYDRDYALVNAIGSAIEVKIRRVGAEQWETFVLSAEQSVEYAAREKATHA